jgi:hypothetical protein
MTKFEAFKLRMALLRIWFMKNLVVFFELGFFVIVVLIITGQVNETTPILGQIFGELSISIREALSRNTSTGEFWTDLISTIVTILVSTGLLSSNLKRVAISDIKSKSLKKALLQAGMYFNRDGKLVKRIEEASKIDLNGDNKIGDTGISVDDIPKEGFFPGIKRAGEELGTILTMKIETTDDAKVIEEKTEMSGTKEALVAVREEVKATAEGAIVQQIDRVIEEPGLAAKLGKKTASAAKGVITGFGKFFVDIASMIGNGFSSLWKKIFTKKEKALKSKKVKVEEVVVQPVVAPVATAESVADARRKSRLDNIRGPRNG